MEPHEDEEVNGATTTPTALAPTIGSFVPSANSHSYAKAQVWEESNPNYSHETRRASPHQHNQHQDSKYDGQSPHRVSDNQREHESNRPPSIVVDFTSLGDPPVIYCDDATSNVRVLKTSPIEIDDDVPARTSRKRQRPVTPVSASYSHSNVTFSDLKLDFAGYEITSGTPDSSHSTPTTYGRSNGIVPTTTTTVASSTSAPSFPVASHSQQQPFQVNYPSSHHEVSSFLQSLNLSIAQHDGQLHRVVDTLVQYGFDTIVSLTFADLADLQTCGIVNEMEARTVNQEAVRVFQSQSFDGPGDLHRHQLSIARWLSLCGIPQSSAVAYAEQLHQRGYTSVLQLEYALNDPNLPPLFRSGHYRLFMYFLNLAVRSSSSVSSSSTAAYAGYATTPTSHPYAPHSYSVLPQPLDVNNRDHDQYDGVLWDTLLAPTPTAAAAPSRFSPHGSQYYRSNHPTVPDTSLYGMTPSVPYTRSSSTGNELGMTQMLLGAAAATAGSSPLPATSSTTPGPGGMIGLRTVPPYLVELINEAVNQPKPNPCRRGKKIYWSMIASGGMNDVRYQPLQQFTASELQNAYLLRYELPTGGSGKETLWTEELIRLLGRAAQDSRCRHLSKIRWEMLANNTSGVEEYAPLSKFTASQLRSRHRSLYGDKQPQKLRQRKEMQRLQQEQLRRQHLLQQQQQQQQQQHAYHSHPAHAV